MTSWTGSCADSFTLNKMAFSVTPEKFCDQGGSVFIILYLILNPFNADNQQMLMTGQYLLADLAYSLAATVIPAYKAPAAYVRKNTEFNYCLAKAQVQDKNTIGILKNQWSSLHEIQLHLYEQPHMN
jgi:hypothetical protein